MVGFICPKCMRGPERHEDEELSWVVDGGTLEEVEQFCYLGNILDSEAGVEREVRARVAAAWRNWWVLSSLFGNKGIPLKSRGKVYEACIRSILLYGAETWALTDRLMKVLRGCDRKMLRYMAGVRMMDPISSKIVAERCGLTELTLWQRDVD